MQGGQGLVAARPWPARCLETGDAAPAAPLTLSSSFLPDANGSECDDASGLAYRTILSENNRMTSLRADAAARRALILDAADHVFGNHGVTAPLDLVVERAQVGRATLYRNFPDRSALIEALLQRTVDRIARHVAELGDRDDALFELLEGMARRIIDSPALADYWRAVRPDDPTMEGAREAVRGLMAEPIQRAIAAGLCRPDLTSTDISLISGMLGAALRGKTREERTVLARRALQLLRGGLQGTDRTEA